jgi:hypothetical protein
MTIAVPNAPRVRIPPMTTGAMFLGGERMLPFFSASGAAFCVDCPALPLVSLPPSAGGGGWH